MRALYHYVGPDEIRRRAAGSPLGRRVESVRDLLDWSRETKQVRTRRDSRRSRLWWAMMASSALRTGVPNMLLVLVADQSLRPANCFSAYRLSVLGWNKRPTSQQVTARNLSAGLPWPPLLTR